MKMTTCLAGLLLASCTWSGSTTCEQGKTLRQSLIEIVFDVGDFMSDEDLQHADNSLTLIETTCGE